MKILSACILSILSLFSTLRAEILEPVKWKFSSEQLSADEYKLIFEAKIEKGWHLYSLFIADNGPVPTTINFEESPSYEIVGQPAEEGESVEKFEELFEMDLKWFERKAIFSQIVKLRKDQVNVKGYLNFMVCDDTRCLPPEDVDFSFALTKKKKNNSEELIKKKEKKGNITGDDDPSGSSSLQNTPNEIADIDDNKGSPEEKREKLSSKLDTPLESSSLWTIFILGFGGGLLALLTPCVFPMIPLTVSFFTKQSANKAKGIANALIYGFSIIVIYVLLGFLVTKIFGPAALNEFSTNVWLNLFFFVIFVVFAISFFGAFEISLPTSWINKTDAASDKGGLIGIFFMALTLTLVSFSCTGPIIGTLLVEAAVNGGVIGPLVGMLGFSSALALPFAIFAAFPGWLNSLPKSGGWLNSVKVCLGFLELAAALKFLSNADLVTQSWIITREVFLVFWIVIFALMGLYLLGMIMFSHDSDLSYISTPRLFFALLSFSFSLYLLPGLWGAPLSLISGFPPPMFYTEWRQNVSPVSDQEDSQKIGSVHCPHHLDCFHDYEKGMAYAEEVGKPVMIDFTGWACVNCRKMEENVWSDPRVLKILQEEYVLISLYVDEKIRLPKKEFKEVKIGGKMKKIRTVGHKWSYLQTSRFGNNSQPWYVLQDTDENVLVEPRGYTPDVETYINFLTKGLEQNEQLTAASDTL